MLSRRTLLRGGLAALLALLAQPLKMMDAAVSIDEGDKWAKLYKEITSGRAR